MAKFRGYDLKTSYVLWLGYMHVLAVVGIYQMLFMNINTLMKTFLGIVIFHAMGGLGITAGCHRLWAHRAYSASYPVRLFLMLMNSVSFQGSIFHWSRDHRLHHKFSDTDLDPHSMNKGFFFSHMGWLLVEKSEALVQEGRKINLKDLFEDPIVMFQKKHYFKVSFLMCFIIPTIVGYFMIGQGLIYSFLTLGCLRYVGVLHATWCVNSVCHMFGTRPWNKNILPADNFWVSIVTLGEGWHNWHHEYPKDWKASKDDWWMINPTAQLIRIWRLFGLASTDDKAVKTE